MTKRLPRAWLCPISRDELGCFHQELYPVEYEQIPQQIRTIIGNRLATLMAEFMGKPITPELVTYAGQAMRSWAEWWNRVEASNGLQIIRAGVTETRKGLDIDIGFSRYGVPLKVIDWYNSEFSASERIICRLSDIPRYSAPYLNYVHTFSPT